MSDSGSGFAIIAGIFAVFYLIFLGGVDCGRDRTLSSQRNAYDKAVELNYFTQAEDMSCVYGTYPLTCFLVINIEDKDETKRFECTSDGCVHSPLESSK